MSATAQGEIEITLKMTESAMNAQIMAAQEANAKASTKRVADNEKQVLAILASQRQKFIADGLTSEVAAIEQVISLRKKASEYKSLGFSQERAMGMAKSDVLSEAKIRRQIEAQAAAVELAKNTETSMLMLSKQRAKEQAQLAESQAGLNAQKLREQAQLAESQAGLNAQKLRELEITKRIQQEEAKIGMDMVNRSLVQHEMTRAQASAARAAYQSGHNTYTGMGGARRGDSFMGGRNLAYKATNLGYQLQDVAISLQMGMSLSRVIAQQGSQIASLTGTVRGAVAGTILAVVPAIIDFVQKTEQANAAWDRFGQTVIKYGQNSEAFSLLAAKNTGAAENLKNIRIYGEQQAAIMKAESDHLEEVERIRSTSGSRILARKAIEAENEKYEQQILLLEEIETKKSKSKVAQLAATRDDLAFSLTSPSKSQEMARLASKLVDIKKEQAGEGGARWLELENEALEIQNKLKEMGLAIQSDIDSTKERARSIQKQAMESELTGQQKLNRLTAEYASLVEQINKANSLDKPALQLKAAEVMKEAVGAKKQAEGEKKQANKEKEDARKDALRAKIDAELSPFEQINQMAADIESGKLSPQGRSAQRAQERAHNKALETAARAKAKQMYGRNWNKLSGTERDYQTKLLMHNANVAANRDKIEARFNKDDIDGIVAAIEKLLAK